MGLAYHGQNWLSMLKVGVGVGDGLNWRMFVGHGAKAR